VGVVSGIVVVLVLFLRTGIVSF